MELQYNTVSVQSSPSSAVAAGVGAAVDGESEGSRSGGVRRCKKNGHHVPNTMSGSERVVKSR